MGIKYRAIAALLMGLLAVLLLGSQSVARPPSPEPSLNPQRFAPVTVQARRPEPEPPKNLVLAEPARPPDIDEPKRSQPEAKAESIVKVPKVSGSWRALMRACYLSRGSTPPNHIAIDLAGCAGAKVVPFRSGRVVFAGWMDNGGGYQVWVSHGGGLFSTYNHLSRETTSPGARVRTSTVIGYVGQSGNVTGPHLHFEVWLGQPWSTGAVPVNPMGYI